MSKNNNPFAYVPRIVAQAVIFILLFVVALSCEKTEEPPQLSSETEILSVTADGLIDTHIQVLTDPDVLEIVRRNYGGNHVSIAFVGLTVSHGTELSTLFPQFTLSPGATIRQVLEHIEDAYGEIHEMDFSTRQVHYIITAEDGKTTSYVIMAAWHPREVKETLSRSSTSATYVNISHSAGGRTIPAAGRHRHDIQFQLNILSAPSHLYRLRAWYVNGVHRSTGATFWDFVSANDTIRAEFERIPPGTVTVQSDSPRMGTASSTVLPNGRVNIVAVPTQGHYFVGWYRNNVRITEWWGTIANATFDVNVTESISLIARFRPNTTISGPILVCFWGTFTMTNQFPPNATVTWTHSPNLQHLGNGTFLSIGPPSAQASWVQANVSGFSTRRHELWVGTPFVSGVSVTPIHTGGNTIRRFTAFFPEIQRAMIRPAGWIWILDAPSCCARFVSNTNRESVDIQFDGGGFFDLIVSATNDCGEGTPSWNMIYYFGRNDGMRESARAQSRPISGTFHVLLSYEADARIQNTYDVRIYDSVGNRVRQVIAEDGRVEFDLSDLPDGTYYLHICDGVEESMIQPIVVENRSERQ